MAFNQNLITFTSKKWLFPGKLLFTACILFAVSAVSASNVSFCGACYNYAQFESAALAATPIPAEPGSELVSYLEYPVYVVNPDSTETRFFVVHASRDWHSTVMAAVAGPGEVATKTTIEGLATYRLNLITGEISAEDFTDIGSAISLFGPPDSPSHQTRQQLLSDLEDFLTTGLLSQSGLVGLTAFTNLVNHMFGHQLNTRMVIVFPDGSTVEISIESVHFTGPMTISVSFEFHDDTGHLHDGTVIPSGSLGNFEYFGGSADVVNQLRELAMWWGIPVTGAGGGGLRCRGECDQSGCSVTCTEIP